MFLLRFFVYSNLLISIVAGILVYGFSTYLESEKSLFYSLVVFGATLFTYNLHRILRLKDLQLDYSNRHLWIIKHPSILYLLATAGLCISCFFYFVHFFSSSSLIILGGVGLISASYAWRIKVNRKALRELPYVKIYLIGISWVVVCFVWPILHEQLRITDYWQILLASFLYIFAATIPFDIRDFRFDSPDQKTIPHLFGEKNSKLIGAISLILSFVLLAWNSTDFLYNELVILAYLGMLCLIILTRQKNHELYFSLLIDGWIIFFGLAFYIF